MKRASFFKSRLVAFAVWRVVQVEALKQDGSVQGGVSRAGAGHDENVFAGAYGVIRRTGFRVAAVAASR